VSATYVADIVGKYEQAVTQTAASNCAAHALHKFSQLFVDIFAPTSEYARFSIAIVLPPLSFRLCRPIGSRLIRLMVYCCNRFKFLSTVKIRKALK